MKNVLTLALLLCPIIFLSAQRADIDKFRIQIRYAGLPTNYIEPDKRTYKVEGPNTENTKIHGWQNIDDNPQMLVKTVRSQFKRGGGKLDKHVKETKNKEGKVTKRTTTYSVTEENTPIGVMYVYGIKNEFKTERELEKEAKENAKRKEKEDEKAAEEAANPFLSGVETEVEEEENSSSDSYSDKRVYRIDLSKSYKYTTKSYKTTKAAWDEFNNNKENEANNHSEEYDTYMKSQFKHHINGLYGYAPKKKTMVFRVLDSKKHPETEMYQQAMDALKIILGKMRYNQDVEQVKKDAAPIIDYLTKLTTKYTEDKKHPKRIRRSALHNLALYYQCVDDFENSNKYAQMQIDTGLDKGRGKRNLDANEDLMAKLAFHNMDTRHLISTGDPEEEIAEDEEEEEEDDDEDDDEGGK